LDEMLDVVVAVASEHGGGRGGNEHAPASMLVGLLFFFKPYHCRGKNRQQ